MKIGGEQLRDSHGMVLMSSLAILSVLLAVGIGVRVMLQNDYRVLANLRGGTEAFYYSAAGVEWSKNEIAGITAFPPAPPNQTKAFASGGFAVSFLSPVTAGPLTARVVVRSVGTAGSSSHVLQAQQSKTYDLADGALVLRGNAARIDLNPTGIFISGIDHDPANGTPLSAAKSRNAISVADDTVRDLLLQALGNPPQAGVLDSASDVPAIALSGYLPASVVSQLANDLCASAGAVSQSIPSSGSLSLENQVWGSLSSPQLRCIEGLATANDALILAGNVSGAGILVVKNADLILTGSFHWEGLIVIVGEEVGLKTVGSASKELIGAALVSETGTPGSSTAILDIQGSLRLLFSRQALKQSAQLIPSATLNNTYAALPWFISQDYWRTASP